MTASKCPKDSSGCAPASTTRLRTRSAPWRFRSTRSSHCRQPQSSFVSLKGHGFSRATVGHKVGVASQAAEKPNPEGGGGFNPRIKPHETMWALAPEECFSPIELECRPFPQHV